MPNTAPPTTTRAAIEDKLARARGRMHCDHAFYVGATPQISAPWASWNRCPGVCGIKAFLGSSTGTLLLNKEEDILAVLKAGKRRVAVHSEDEDRMIARKHLAERGKPQTHPVWRDAEAARMSTERVLGLAQQPAGACMCCMSPPATRFRCWRPPRILPPPKPRRSI